MIITILIFTEKHSSDVEGTLLKAADDTGEFLDICEDWRFHLFLSVEDSVIKSMLSVIELMMLNLVSPVAQSPVSPVLSTSGCMVTMLKAKVLGIVCNRWVPPRPNVDVLCEPVTSLEPLSFDVDAHRIQNRRQFVLIEHYIGCILTI